MHITRVILSKARYYVAARGRARPLPLISGPDCFVMVDAVVNHQFFPRPGFSYLALKSQNQVVKEGTKKLHE